MDTTAARPHIAIFADFLDEEIAVLGAYADNVQVPVGEAVFAAGSNDRSLYVVIEGCLSAEIPTPDGEPVTVGLIEAGDVFGELSFLDGQPRTAAIVCLAEATLLRLSRAGFDRLQAEHPAIAAKLMSDLALVISLRLRAADQLIASLSHKA